jgi:GYF domain 2
MLNPTVMVWLVFGAVSAYIAHRRGKNPYLWFFLGTFFGLFGILFLFLAPRPKAPKTDPNTIDITPIFSTEHRDKLWYYIDGRNTRHGPMSFQALSKAWSQGKILPTTYVWNESLPDWRPFGEFIIQ